MTPALVSETLPKAMGPHDMQRVFGLSPSAFRRHQTAGEFRPFELPRRIGTKRYSGEKVQSFLRGRQ